jgi:hypothetical protein
MMIEAKAQVGIYSVMCNQQWKPNSTNFGHTKKSRDMEHEPTLQMGADRMLPRYEVCPESNENGIPTLPTAVGGEGQV